MLCALVSALAAPGCSETRTVPFKLDTTSDSTDTGPGVPVHPAPPPNLPEQPTLVGSGGSLRPALRRQHGLVVHAELPASGEREGWWVVASRTDPAMQLQDKLGIWRLRATPDNGRVELVDLPRGQVVMPVDCAPARAQLRSLGGDLVLGSVSARCKDEPATLQHIWVTRNGKSPRVLKHFEHRGGPVPRITMDASVGDEDGDGRPDLKVRLLPGPRSEAAGDSGPRTAAGLILVWLDTPSGLVAQPGALERGLTLLAERAETLLEEAPEQALAKAHRVLELSAELCREGSAPGLRVDGNPGLPCGNREARTRALTVQLRAQADSGQVADALQSYALLLPDIAHIADAQRASMERSLQGMPAPAARILWTSPELPGENGASVKRSRLRFEDNDTLLIDGTTSQRVNLTSGEVQQAPAAHDFSDLVTSPDGGLAVTSIRRNCQGRFLRIVPTRLALQADSVVRTSRPPMLERLARSSGCAREPADTGGWTVLTWRAEGILAIRDSTLVQVPVDTSGKAAGAPVTLRGSTTPLWPGQADLLGHSLERWVRVTPFGLISYRLGAPDRSILVRAPGLPVGEPHPGTLAWSPNDTRLGLWIGNRVVVLQWPKPQ